MVTYLKINTVMGGFKLLESHNRSVSDLYFTIFALQMDCVVRQHGVNTYAVELPLFA